MNKLLTLLLSLFLLISVNIYANHPSGCVVVQEKPESREVFFDTIEKCRAEVKKLIREDSRKLCIEYNYKDDCRKVRKFENGVYKFGSQKMKVLDNL